MIDLNARELDKLCDDFEDMSFKADAWWPSIEEIKEYIEPKLKTMLPFAIWITETANKPETEEEIQSKKYLLRLIYDNVNIIYDNDEDGVDE